MVQVQGSRVVGLACDPVGLERSWGVALTVQHVLLEDNLKVHKQLPGLTCCKVFRQAF